MVGLYVGPHVLVLSCQENDTAKMSNWQEPINMLQSLLMHMGEGYRCKKLVDMELQALALAAPLMLNLAEFIIAGTQNAEVAVEGRVDRMLMTCRQLKAALVKCTEVQNEMSASDPADTVLDVGAFSLAPAMTAILHHEVLQQWVRTQENAAIERIEQCCNDVKAACANQHLPDNSWKATLNPTDDIKKVIETALSADFLGKIDVNIFETKLIELDKAWSQLWQQQVASAALQNPAFCR